jgi:septal ring factor EnvC (AmiA/AmiB activator)
MRRTGRVCALKTNAPSDITSFACSNSPLHPNTHPSPCLQPRFQTEYQTTMSKSPTTTRASRDYQHFRRRNLRAYGDSYDPPVRGVYAQIHRRAVRLSEEGRDEAVAIDTFLRALDARTNEVGEVRAESKKKEEELEKKEEELKKKGEELKKKEEHLEKKAAGEREI